MDCPSCPHGRRQHSIRGCTSADPDGSNKCTCPNTYMDLSPRNPNPPKKNR